MSGARPRSRPREELVAASAAIRAVLAAGAEARLRAIPGVVHVSVGLKERARRVTETLCIRVYVREKRPEDALAPEARVPREVDGVPTDVNVVRRATASQVITTRYRPVKGGILISNGILAMHPAPTDADPDAERPGYGVGTFGCTATRVSDGDIMLLTNAHVLISGGADKGAPIFQPGPLSIPAVDPADLPLQPRDDTDKIAVVADWKLDGRVDAGIARLDVSSCCRCCGIDWRDEVEALSDAGSPPSDKLLGMRAAVEDAVVYKVGIRTGRTVGRIVDIDLPAMDIDVDGDTVEFEGQIEITSEGDPDLEPFSLEGDSGAVIVDEEGWVVGLLFAGYAGEVLGERRTYANHISEVCAALGITLNLDRTTDDSSGARATVAALRPSDADVELYAVARARLLGDPAGEWLWATGEAHREEVVRLVTRHRPVTVAWHRAGGPALFARALETLRAGGDALPRPTRDDTLEGALAQVGGALAAHGSPALREAIATHGAALLDAVRGAVTVGDVLRRLQEAGITERGAVR